MTDDAISESVLIDSLKNRAVKNLSIVQDEDYRFRIYATLTWKQGCKCLETQRKKPRTWVSLDRLVRHINSRYGNVPILQLELRSSNDEIS